MDRLEHDFGDHSAIIYMYFDYKEQGVHKLTNVLGSILKQICQAFKPGLLPNEIRRDLSVLTTKIRTRQVDLKDYTQLIVQSMESFARVFLIFDALDEYGSDGARQELLRTVEELQHGGTNIHVLITCRPHISVDLFFASSNSIEIRAHDSDLELLIRAKLSAYSHISANLKEDILIELMSMANGT